MPTEEMIVLIAIIVPFVVFVTLVAWVDYYASHRPRS